jgi:hypothetical protein
MSKTMKKDNKYVCDKGKLVSRRLEKGTLVIKHIYGTYIFDHLVKKNQKPF